MKPTTATPIHPLYRGVVKALVVLILLGMAPGLRADDSRTYKPPKPKIYSSKGGTVLRQYTLEDRVRYQLWDYKWKPDPDQPISRIEVRIGEQKVYVYQGDRIAAESPVTTGKPGHDTPTGHFTITQKDADHKSNLFGVLVDEHGNIVDSNAESANPPPSGLIYDAADMPYYLRLSDNGVGLHAGYLPGHPASHGCIRLPHAFAELLFSNVSEGTPVDVVP